VISSSEVLGSLVGSILRDFNFSKLMDGRLVRNGLMSIFLVMRFILVLFVLRGSSFLVLSSEL
jgi:hypothetical protein